MGKIYVLLWKIVIEKLRETEKMNIYAYKSCVAEEVLACKGELMHVRGSTDITVFDACRSFASHAK